MRVYPIALLLIGAIAIPSAKTSAADNLPSNLATLRQAGPGDQSQADLQAAWQSASAAGIDDLTTILSAMKDAPPLAENWLRSVADAIAERELAAGRSLPTDQLESFVLDGNGPARGRRVAYQWLTHVDDSAAERLLPRLLDDSSLEIRHDAVARLIEQAESTSDADQQLAVYQRAVRAARELEQIEQCCDQLAEFGETVDRARLMGFVTTWQVIGPFDNTDQQGFAVAYPPEQQVDAAATHDGKVGTVVWKEYATDDQYVMVDLNDALEKHMGAAGYAWAEFHVPADVTATIRWGSPNATKLWVNGEEIASHEVYHANQAMDQYTATAPLRAGANTILVKVCQNEQTDPWAQVWQFQLRVTDQLGGPFENTDE
jgi:hypothetical protein